MSLPVTAHGQTLGMWQGRLGKGFLGPPEIRLPGRAPSREGTWGAEVFVPHRKTGAAQSFRACAQQPQRSPRFLPMGLLCQSVASFLQLTPSSSSDGGLCPLNVPVTRDLGLLPVGDVSAWRVIHPQELHPWDRK